MSARPVVIALDCGTHAARTLAFDVETGAYTTCAEAPIPLLFPHSGWVEIDPDVLARAAISVTAAAFGWARERGHEVLALGLANMRETAFSWRPSTGLPVHDGIMWMSQQSQPTVDRWRSEGLDPTIRERTGLSNDAFFFGSKVAWLLEHDPVATAAAADGDLAVGTPESWLLYRLSGGRTHRTDVANASRTQVLDLRSREWDPLLCATLGVPRSALPEVTPTAGDFGRTDAAVCGLAVPITGVIADQQAALLGHGCEQRGDAKTTFGTSGVVMVNLGPEVQLRDGLVTSVAWNSGAGDVAYEIEGSAFHSGYSLGWLDERFGRNEGFAQRMSASGLSAKERVYLLPSFSVLGAPRWPAGRGAVMTGLAMDSQPDDLRRAAVEAMAFHAYDNFAALGDLGAATREMNVDGGGATNDFLCQLLADLLGCDVVRPKCRELTSVGAAKAALRGLGCEVDPWFGQQRDAADRFLPSGSTYAREGYDHWVDLVDRILV